MTQATGIPAERLCRACFDGVYPVALPDSEEIGQLAIEGFGRVDADGLTTVLGGHGAGDALRRP